MKLPALKSSPKTTRTSPTNPLIVPPTRQCPPIAEKPRGSSTPHHAMILPGHDSFWCTHTLRPLR
ncbi:hypothetical protein L484_002299 [Morus notabilis]|uniref:Uncharacterized protein n=1 Tax=Morus notabilis TaxID=981085 RepID=W9QSJ1_9ROSA|nr:hypothetical protein L484_002299 [Morus notabilis]